jgi:hypothetical protein
MLTLRRTFASLKGFSIMPTALHMAAEDAALAAAAASAMPVPGLD